MKLYKKIIAGLLTVSLLACINWNYLGNLWGLTWDAAMGLVSGETVSTTALQSELDSLSLGKLLKFNIDGFSPDDNVTTEDVVLDDTTEEFDADTTEDKSGSWSWMDLDDLPQNVQNAYKKYDEAGWQGNVSGQTPGTKAGKTYYNMDGKLPTGDTNGNPITYKEFDVNNKQPGQNRDGERFVTGSDGSIYYTDSHYGEGDSLNGLPAFVRIR